MPSLPNLIIAGVHLSGTTSLFTYLGSHPEICPSSFKETLYFLPLRQGGELPPLDEYRRFFRHCGSQRYLLEASPGYFQGGRTIAEAIKEVLGEVRIIIILRDPVDRLLSNYKYLKKRMILDRRTSLQEFVANRRKILERKYGATDNSYWAIQAGFYADFLDDCVSALRSAARSLR